MNNTDTLTELKDVMTQALLRLQALVTNDPTQQHDLLAIAKTFLLGDMALTTLEQAKH